MKIEEIRELAQIMKENGLGMLELQEDGTNLRMEAASAAAPAAPVSCLWYKRCPPLHPCRQLRQPLLRRLRQRRWPRRMARRWASTI